jgi:hypothetical protein
LDRKTLRQGRFPETRPWRALLLFRHAFGFVVIVFRVLLNGVFGGGLASLRGGGLSGITPRPDNERPRALGSIAAGPVLWFVDLLAGKTNGKGAVP